MRNPTRESGRPSAEMVEDALIGYFDAEAQGQHRTDFDEIRPYIAEDKLRVIVGLTDRLPIRYPYMWVRESTCLHGAGTLHVNRRK